MAFSGYIAYGYSISDDMPFIDDFLVKKDIRECGFDDEFPSPEEFAFGYYIVFGDPVLKIEDKNGKLIWDNAEDFTTRMRTRNLDPNIDWDAVDA